MNFKQVLVLILVLHVLFNGSDHHFIVFVNGGNALANQYYKIGDVAINCGSVSNSTALDGREWIRDAPSKFLSGKSRTSAAAEKSFSIDPVPYKTSRISPTEFSYTFEVNPGQKFIRLHFYPASYRGFENSVDFFTVKAGPFTLLRDFSASLTVENMGVKYLVKEFCLNVEENKRLNITFLPSLFTKSKLNIHAFVNGIEIISMPTGLYYTLDGDLGAPVVGQKNRFCDIDNSTALEMTHRLNIGGSAISSLEDFGMFRRWSEDTNYLLESRVHRVNHQALRIKYAYMPGFIAPPKLFQTSWKAGGYVRENQLYNITWKIPTELGFVYLVRLHFCQLDDGMAECEQMEFTVLINNHIVESQADVIRWSGGNGSPVYRDYIVKMKGNKEGSKCDLLIGLQSANELVFGLLNGLEIFKLSNLVNSLATPNPTFPKIVLGSWNLAIQKVLLAFGKSNVVGTGMTIFIILVNVVVYSLRQIWEDKSNLETDKQTSRTKPSFHCFSLVEIKSATQDFSDAFVIGRGGFGKVYKAFIPSISETVAVKRLKSDSRQGAHEFWTEIETLSMLRHVHLVSLLGYCNEGLEMILIYEYMPCGTLADNLYKLSRMGKDVAPLSWEQRLRVSIGAARGLEYLHTGTERTVIHRDVKDSNILLDDNLVAKISDFGLSKLEKEIQSKSYVSTKVKGTNGYFDPEYVMTGKLTRKSDVYAFGVVLLVVLSGRPAIDTKSQEQQSLLSYFRECITEGDIDGIVDLSLQGKIPSKSLTEFLKSVENCLHHLPKKRPTMAQVIASLEQALEQQESPMVSSSWNATLNGHEVVPMLGQNVIPSPEEGITSNLTQNTYSPPRNDLQPRRKDYARVLKPSWNWPWKAIWNRGPGALKKITEAGPLGPGALEKITVSGSFVGSSTSLTRITTNKSTEFSNQDTESGPLVGGSISLTHITMNKSIEFSYQELAEATNDFSMANKIGQSGFGSTFYGELRGERAAIKRMDKQASREFLTELKVLTHVHHLNLVRLIGYCVKGSLCLVYEYIENGNLAQHLRDSGREPMPWSTRVQIALDSAKGLEHIHEHTVPVCIHRDIKSANILIEKNFRAKVTDFGLAKLTEVGSSSPTRLVGTFGYIPPEYAEYGNVSPKADVYAFGVVLYELISAKAAIAAIVEGGSLKDSKGLVALFEEAFNEPDPPEALIKLMDPRLGDDCPLDSVRKVAQLARTCTHENPLLRPSMRSIVVALMTLSSTNEDWDIGSFYENQGLVHLMSGR